MVSTTADEQKLLTQDSVSFQALPDKNESDSEAAAAIRESLHNRIRKQEAEEAEREKQKAITAEQARITEDEVYKEFVEYAKANGFENIPSKTELIGFYGLKAGVEFDRVIKLITMMRGENA